jgi:hypothetical protein
MAMKHRHTNHDTGSESTATLGVGTHYHAGRARGTGGRPGRTTTTDLASLGQQASRGRQSSWRRGESNP